MATPSEHDGAFAPSDELTSTLYLSNLPSIAIGEISMCGERDEFLSQGNEVLVTSHEEARAAIAAGQQPLVWDIKTDSLVFWAEYNAINPFDVGVVPADEPSESEASCADWSAGFIGLKPRPPKAPPPPLSIPLRALAHRVGSAPLLEH